MKNNSGSTRDRVTAAALALSLSGCSATPRLPRMEADQSIEIDTGVTGPRYTQHGEVFDLGSMKAQLEKEPAAVGDVNGALAMRVVGTLMGAVGGGLIGWPLGQAAARGIAGPNTPDPQWALAGAGAGVAVSGILLSGLSVLVLDRAVRTHNRALLAMPAPPIAEPRRRAAPVPGAISAAFTLGASVAVAEARCARAGLTWQKSAEGLLSCSGVPVDLGTPVTATVTLCGERVCEVTLDASPDGAAWSALTQRFVKLDGLLAAVHGDGRLRKTASLADCDQVVQRCFPIGRIRTSTTWALPAEQSASLTLDGGPLGGAPSLRLVYSMKGAL